jgi:hypothetical protein
MSNNKQSMKLYTEEQVKEMIGKSQATGLNADFLILSTPPIELPSDEEIDKEAFQVPYDNTQEFYDLQFIKGAQWMRDKIQGGNK